MEQKNPSLVITVCHYSADLLMPNGDPRDGLFYPTRTLMIYYYDVLPGEQFSRISGAFITNLFLGGGSLVYVVCRLSVKCASTVSLYNMCTIMQYC